ncbi:MAG: hypothetical protein K0R38_7657 [Polyangiaceae bacterium]|nr:hypothetical protein [Polyangiaceae bacterium]
MATPDSIQLAEWQGQLARAWFHVHLVIAGRAGHTQVVKLRIHSDGAVYAENQLWHLNLDGLQLELDAAGRELHVGFGALGSALGLRGGRLSVACSASVLQSPCERLVASELARPVFRSERAALAFAFDSPGRLA